MIPPPSIRNNRPCTECVFMQYTDPLGTAFRCIIHKDPDSPCDYHFTESEIIEFINHYV